ncbi:MAG: DUF2330 domain-containing protein [Deltaproteobacteria bacterium]|nr:DUF2330 domain-containing protein [Deltaproteobacteria bacterium]
MTTGGRTSFGSGLVVALLCGAVAAPQTASAFCGFYVSGSGQQLYNKATYVVMMREGTRTVLSMQNNYEGPPEAFAMVVPVPVVLQRENVHTLERSVFDRVDQLAAPRLVEYWEQDPCTPRRPPAVRVSRAMVMGAAGGGRARAADDLGVRIEAQFVVGEYDIVILSASDSSGLDTWLRRERYNIPPGAEPVLRPYVAAGTKFFVARVDPQRVRFENGRAMLSPLRFHYDTERFDLPVRLGLLNSAGEQDLIVHILSRGQRFEVANYRNVTIPTNIDVANSVRERFGSFYAALFDRTVQMNPGAVVTEYAWGASSCDPCPVSPLDPRTMAVLGEDVLPPRAVPSSRWDPRQTFVLTRLHYRYTRDSLGEDLVFREAGAIVGGREIEGREGRLERVARPAEVNNFQARYVIRHWWQGPIRCANPRRGVWGGPPGGGSPRPTAARDLAFVPRNVRLDEVVRRRVPEIRLAPRRRGNPFNPPLTAPGTADRQGTTDDETRTAPSNAAVRGAAVLGCSAVGTSSDGIVRLASILAALLIARRRKG